MDFDELIHGVEVASLAVWSRAVLSRAHTDEPDAVSVRITATIEAGLSTVEVGIHSRSGLEIGSYSL